eukprot:2751544-Alexandrium_andersonii.AAC.1
MDRDTHTLAGPCGGVQPATLIWKNQQRECWLLRPIKGASPPHIPPPKTLKLSSSPASERLGL